MAFRLRFSARALREIGEDQEWYELKNDGLGEEFLAEIESPLKTLEQTPFLYAEVIPSVRRALLSRFPYGIFYTVRGNLVHILAVLHEAHSPSRWPKPR